MTIWVPKIEPRPGPRYLAIADALADDVESGRLAPGTRLPTHRDLASRLGVTVGTVSRAYAEAERRGLTQGEIGRGTFVRNTESAPISLQPLRPREPGAVDLTIVRPAEDPYAEAITDSLSVLAKRTDLKYLLNYAPDGGLPEHRAAGAEWIRRRGLKAEREQVIVTSGAQHGLATVIAALTEPGDLLLTEALGYAGINAIASQLHRRQIQGVEMDEHGIRPDSLEAACRNGNARILVCVATLQNPTTAIMPEERRRQIANVVRRHDLILVDDDVYGPLVEDSPAPLASFAPERSCYITSISKSLTPGLRIGYILAPDNFVPYIAASVRTSVWMPAPLMAEITTLWIRDGVADRLIAWQRQEACARQLMAGRLLKRWHIQSHPNSFHLWLHLPDPWRADAFTQQARARGVAVVPADFFAVGRARAPHAVRLCLTAAASRQDLERGLIILDEILAGPPKSCMAVI